MIYDDEKQMRYLQWKEFKKEEADRAERERVRKERQQKRARREKAEKEYEKKLRKRNRSKPNVTAIVGTILLVFSVAFFLIATSGKSSQTGEVLTGKPSDMPDYLWERTVRQVQRGANVSRSDAEKAAQSIWKVEQRGGLGAKP
jgi:hypothetical protein